ncbi:hypothetical protein [Endozoicomonas arenosclerae]|uniref:hypothetical protein n=1 Tax=Endozoicomonas arenosclerae TaxID=1633495 RepID=UPI00129481F2|nr:hypothetical protein [Endozoicomonas arenosclerae]
MDNSPESIKSLDEMGVHDDFHILIMNDSAEVGSFHVRNQPLLQAHFILEET